MKRVLSIILCLAALAACRSAPPAGGNDAGTPPAAPDAGPGVHPSTSGDYTFIVDSLRATRLELSLYAQPLGAAPVARYPLEQSGRTWSVTVTANQLQAAGLGAVFYYGYRAWGPNWTYDPSWTPGSNAGFVADVDPAGNRFNPNKLLVDPYALELSHDPYQPNMVDGSVYGSGSNRDKDSGPAAAKGIVWPAAVLDTGTAPARPFRDDIIEEVHLRGLTRNDPDAGCPGTFAEAGRRAPYLAALGVTAVEFLPVQETQNDTNTDTQPGNYWGYSTLGFFAPDRHYACDKSPGGPTREFAGMVKAFHAAGLKVFMDVVYNHTAETGSRAILSFTGLDNAHYYELDAAGTGYTDNTGLGGNVNAADPLVRDWVMATLHYWTGQMGVDGFRFDLAPVLGNVCESGCFAFDPNDPGSVLNRAVAELPGVPLIAEPWGIGNGTYQTGNFPNGWSTWNDHFRDLIRSSQNKLGFSAPTMGALANALSGSPDLYDSRGRGPIASIDYITCHDGFTLADQYACNAPNNGQAWPYGPSGGGIANNNSWDHGGDPVQQAQALRTGLALVMLAAGTPMMNGGDELSRSVRCNNNPYNLDSIGNWIDWSQLPAYQGQLAFVQNLTAFRSAHRALRPSSWWTGAALGGSGLKDVTWLAPDGSEASSAYLADPNGTFLGMRVDGEGVGDTARSILAAYNEGTAAVTFPVPSAGAGKQWFVAGDATAPGFIAAAGQETVLGTASYAVQPRSVVLLIER